MFPFRCAALAMMAFLVLALGGAATLAADPPRNTAPPLELFDRLADLKLGTAPRLPDDERAFLDKIWARHVENRFAPTKLDDPLVLEAVLLAGGGTADERKKQAERFAVVVQEATEATKEAKSARERGEQLLKHLHRTVLKGKYTAGQSSLGAALTGGTFDSVSAATLYCLVASRLGIDARPVAIPGRDFQAGHASVDFVEGTKRVRVEPVVADGFDWEAKVPRTGTTPGVHAERRTASDVDGLGLAALAYVARAREPLGTEEKKPPEYATALRYLVPAFVLGPTDAVPGYHLVGVFVDWADALVKEKRHEDALRVLALGRSFDAKSRRLTTGLEIAWEEYLDATLAAGKDEEALKLAVRAGKDVPGIQEYESPAYWFGRHGDKLAKDKGFEAALAVAERGLKILPPREAAKLKAWRTGTFRFWSQSLLEKQDIDGSLKVLMQAYKLDPDDSEVQAGVAFHTQEALPLAEKKGMLAGAEAHYQALRKEFPKVADVAEIGAVFAIRRVAKVAEEKKYEEALKAIDAHKTFLDKEVFRADAGTRVYDQWARHLAADKKYPEALAKYAEGLKAYPMSNRLENNAVATVDDWATTAVNEKKWDEAIAIYKAGLKVFPDSAHLKQNLAFCEKKKENP